jgi:hypothetical protein
LNGKTSDFRALAGTGLCCLQRHDKDASGTGNARETRRSATLPAFAGWYTKARSPMSRILRFPILFIALLLSSLVSHGAYVQMAGILLLCAYCIGTHSTRAELLGHRNLMLAAAVLAIITGFFLYYLLFPVANGAPDLEKSAFNNYAFLVLVTLFVLCFHALVVATPDELSASLVGLIVLNTVVQFAQTASLIATNTYIDFVEPVTGEPSRFHNYEGLNPVFAYRPTGLFIEPSTFGAVIASLTIGYVVLGKVRQREAHFFPVLLAIVAMLITQSTAAIVQCALLIFAILLVKGKSARVMIIILCVAALLAAPSFFEAYFNSFAMKMDESSAIRLELLDYIYNVRTGWDWLLGYGPFTLESSLYHLAKPGGGVHVASLNDAGLIQYFVVRFGVLGLIVPALMFMKMRKDLPHVLFFVVIMSLKLNYSEPALFFGLLPLLMRLPARARAPQDSEAEVRLPVHRASPEHLRGT